MENFPLRKNPSQFPITKSLRLRLLTLYNWVSVYAAVISLFVCIFQYVIPINNFTSLSLQSETPLKVSFRVWHCEWVHLIFPTFVQYFTSISYFLLAHSSFCRDISEWIERPRIVPLRKCWLTTLQTRSLERYWPGKVLVVDTRVLCFRPSALSYRVLRRLSVWMAEDDKNGGRQ